MSDLVLEDFSVDQELTGEPVTVTREDIVTFARAYDFQPFHLDEAAAEKTFAGGSSPRAGTRRRSGCACFSRGRSAVAPPSGARHRRAALARPRPAGGHAADPAQDHRDPGLGL